MKKSKNPEPASWPLICSDRGSDDQKGHCDHALDHYDCPLARGRVMKRREFIGWLGTWLGTWLGGGAVAFPVLGSTASRAQNAAANQAGSAAVDNSIGQVASMTGSARVKRRHASPAAFEGATSLFSNHIFPT